jgi:hypothetical protein
MTSVEMSCMTCCSKPSYQLLHTYQNAKHIMMIYLIVNPMKDSIKLNIITRTLFHNFIAYYFNERYSGVSDYHILETILNIVQIISLAI